MVINICRVKWSTSSKRTNRCHGLYQRGVYDYLGVRSRGKVQRLIFQDYQLRISSTNGDDKSGLMAEQGIRTGFPEPTRFFKTYDIRVSSNPTQQGFFKPNTTGFSKTHILLLFTWETNMCLRLTRTSTTSWKTNLGLHFMITQQGFLKPAQYQRNTLDHYCIILYIAFR